jgi:prepilin-type N-terminal cleavage/methylation domain-containing protein
MMSRASMRNSFARKSGFTLIEMLTVIAISAVMLTIIVMPIFQSFNLTRAAQIFATAQNDARALTEKISREIGSAVSVRSGSTTVATTLNGNAVSLPVNSLIVELPNQLAASKTSQPMVDVVVPWTKLDLLLAAQIGPGSAGAYIDPVTGKVDPTLKTFKGQVQTPVVPGTTIVRYSLGLRDPTQPYNEPYSGIMMAVDGTRDNLIAVRRSVAVTYLSGTVTTNGQAVQTSVPNTALFALDTTGKPLLDDPKFLVFDDALEAAASNKSAGVAETLHNLLVYHWLGMSPAWEDKISPNDTIMHNPSNFAHSVLETQVSRFDMVMPQYDLSTRLTRYDTANSQVIGANVGIPRITPLLQFKPTVVSNDPAAGQEALRPGEETDDAVAIAPDMYKTEYGLWNTAIVRTYPAAFSSQGTTNNKYSIGYPSNTTTVPGFSIYAYDPSASEANEFSTGTEYFDMYTYDNAVAMLGNALTGSGLPSRVYPFTQAALAANARSGWITNSLAQSLFTPYDLLPGTGKIRASFDISEVGNVNASLPSPGSVTVPDNAEVDPARPNLPTRWIWNTPVAPSVDTGTTYPLSPVNGSTQNHYDINSAFNEEWNGHPAMQPNIQRFIDLRVVENEDGTYSPLYPVAVAGAVTNFQRQLADGSMQNRVRIVPGSETVTGPDQAPGDHYGHPIRYTRVTTDPGVNQYRINYVDQQEPNTGGSNPQVTVGAYEAAFGPVFSTQDIDGFSVDTYNSTNFISATIQPRYKVGYLQLNSDPSQPLPQGYYATGATTVTSVPFKIDYRFQFTGTLTGQNVPAGTGSSDTFAVDYDTRQLMQVLLTIRSLPQSNLPNPQTVTLKATATLKNVAR